MLRVNSATRDPHCLSPVISNAVRNLLTIFARYCREEISPPRQKTWRVVEMTDEVFKMAIREGF